MDYVSSTNRRQFVIDQLAMYSGVTKRLNEASTFVLCPFHAEKTPSFRVFHSATTRNPFGVCYGCGKKANWDELAPMLGLQGFVKQRPKDEFLNLGILPTDDFGEETAKEVIRFTKLPKNKVWRKISTNLLIEIGAKRCEVKHPEHGWLKPKIYLPVMVKGKERGYIKARIKKHEDLPSYINSSGPWSKTHGLFPYDYAVQMMKTLKSKTIVLVEGPRDALRLLSLGIPAMCILGTHSWTDRKTKILELSGCRTVILLFDGDDAGKEATTKIKKYVAPMFVIKVLKLWSIKGSPYIQFKDEEHPSKAAKEAGVNLWDPASISKDLILKIKRKYFS